MNKRHHLDQRGLGLVVELVVAVILIMAIAVGGYFVYTARNDNKLVDYSAEDLPRAHNAMGFELLKTLHKDKESENVFISPTSIALALSMVYNGAEGDTKTAMADVMNFGELDIAEINSSHRAFIEDMNKAEGVQIAIANSLWMDKGSEIKQSFIDTVQKNYQSKVESLDFSSPSTPDTINAWVAENTKNKITEIVDDTSTFTTFLANATYFKGTWTTEFNKSLTQDRIFKPFDGGDIQHPFMQRYDSLHYLEKDGFQSVILLYGEDKRFQMVVVLPDNINTFIDTITVDKWNKYIDEHERMDGTLLLPRFKFEYEADLIEPLSELGMGVAFTDLANFGGMGDNLFIDYVKHKTYVDVNEEGTEAAAVTGIGVSTTSMSEPIEKTFYMEVNKPFYVAIRDSRTGEMLFSGAIMKPE